MTDTVFVSFVYPSCEKYLPSMFNSLDQQDDNNFDVVLFNDGLRGVEGICKANLRKPVRVIPLSGNIPNIRTKGLKILQGLGYENIIFGDADDAFLSNRISVSKKLLENNSLVVNDIDVINSASKAVIPNYFQKRLAANKSFSCDAIFTFNFIGFTNSSIKASLISELDFPVDLVAIDWALFTKIMLRGVDGFFTNHTNSSYFIHDHSHYNIASPTLDVVLYQAEVRLKHYKYLCESGESFAEEFRQSRLMVEHLKSELSLYQNDGDISFKVVDNPFWWELPSLEIGVEIR